MSYTKKPYYKQIIILMLTALVCFGAFKAILPKRLFPESTTANANIVVDSMMLMAMSDTLNLAVAAQDSLQVSDSTIATQDSLLVPIVVPSMKIVDGSFNPSITAGGHVNLSHFYSKLNALKNDGTSKVRVAYFGDSMNDGDFIVQDVRRNFQEEFGGKGVGFVAITSLSGNARSSVAHQFSNNWLTQSMVRVRKPITPFGIDGQVAYANGQGRWVNYQALQMKSCESLYRPTLFYGRSESDSASVSVTINNAEAVDFDLKPTNRLNKLCFAGSAQSLRIELNNADSIPIYGTNFDNGKGIHIDNYSLRGNSGLPLSSLNVGLMNSFDKALGGYDLVILQYGANVLSSSVESYSWYERNMTAVVNNLRACFPNADVLVLSTADKASMINDAMQTDPAVVTLAISQRNYARKTNSGFLNLYELMGGEGSMIEWVDQKCAAKDYTHFNISGSRRMGRLIYKEIMKGYDKYLHNTPAPSEQVNDANTGEQKQ